MLAAMSADDSSLATTSQQPQLVDVEQVRVVPHAEWDELLERLGAADAYLRLDYHRACALLFDEPAHPVLVHVRGSDGELALPLLLRRLPAGAGFDAASAYGYGGPVAADGPRLDAIGAAIDRWACANAVVASFLRFHPLLGNERHCPSGAELAELGATVAWDVSPGRDLAPAMHTHHRRAARKADRAGVELRVSVNPADLAAFRDIYETTMRRQDATDFYFFPEAHWEALRTAPGGDLVLVEAMLEGELVAALLCIASGPWLHYHLGASTDAARAVGASNRCFLAAAEWAQSRAMTVFHLGGGVGADTSSNLFVFKHRFDPQSEPRPFHVARWVHDRERYRELTGGDSTAGFFPPWRAP